MKKELFEFTAKNGYEYVFEEKASGKDVVLKLGMKLEFKDFIRGNLYFLSINENWLNYAEPVSVQDSPSKTIKKEEVVKPIISQQDMIISQSAMKEATKLYLGILGDNEIDYDKLFEIHKRMYKYMKNGEFAK